MIETAAPVKLTRNEGLKEASPLLAGTIRQTLADGAAERFSEDDYEFLKFHGIYQQDDRDKRKAGKQYILMVRTKFPGGVLTARSIWCAMSWRASMGTTLCASPPGRTFNSTG